MSLWVVIALVFVTMLLLSGAPGQTPPPQVIVLQPMAPPSSTESGCLPLLLFVGAIVAAVMLL